MRVDRNFVEPTKQQYPAGTKIELDRMDDPYRDMPKGLKGIVAHVDDIGQIHCNWENGSTLALIPGEDAFHKIIEREKEQDLEQENDTELER
jgi:hypothetical protein